MAVAIVGCGYLGITTAKLLLARGERVSGTVRSSERARVIESVGVAPIIADVLEPKSLAPLHAFDRVLYCVGYDRRSGAGIREVAVEGVANTLANLSPRTKLVYASSTGVYGQTDAGLVDETSPTAPATESGACCLEAEGVLLAHRAREPGFEPVILRFSGLYGPGRVIRQESLVRGELIAGSARKYLNIIHIEDAGLAVLAAFDRAAAGSIYIVSDDRPVERREYYEIAARILGAPPPWFIGPAEGSVESARDRSDKRVSNERIKRDLAWAPRYRDCAAGLADALGREP